MRDWLSMRQGCRLGCRFFRRRSVMIRRFDRARAKAAPGDERFAGTRARDRLEHVPGEGIDATSLGIRAVLAFLSGWPLRSSPVSDVAKH